MAIVDDDDGGDLGWKPSFPPTAVCCYVVPSYRFYFNKATAVGDSYTMALCI